MIAKLLVTIIMSCFTALGTFEVPNKESKLVPPVRNSAYVYDSTTLEGYYEIGYGDNPLNMIFNVGGDIFSAYNPNQYSSYYFPFLTTFSEGIVDYYPGTCYDSQHVSSGYATGGLFDELSYLLSQNWTSLDFFIFDIPYFITINNSPYLFSWSRYYGIGEQKIGSICYFQDNFAFEFGSFDYGSSSCVFDVFNYSMLNGEGNGSMTLEHRITSDESDIYFTRFYTECRPSLLSFSSYYPQSQEPTCLRYECYLYPFHSYRYFGSSDAVEFDYQYFTHDYKLKFGFSHANSTTGYDSGYQDGYDVGYDKGSEVTDNQLNDKYDEGYDDGYETGYDNGTANVQSQIDIAHTNGYNEGYAAANTNPYTFSSFFGAIADVPILIVRNLLGFQIFGVSAMAILMSMFTGCIALYLLRRIIF